MPQLRQWCFRFVKVKAVRHRMHTSESTHSGGYRGTQHQLDYHPYGAEELEPTALLSIMLLATVTLGGNWNPSIFSVL